MIFYFVSLLFPRIVLLISWFANEIPPNDMPFFGDIMMTIFTPNLLVSYYAYNNGLEFICLLHFLAFLFCLHLETNTFRRSE